MAAVLFLSIDDLHVELHDALYSGRLHTDYDLYGDGHSIAIKAADKEAFLDAVAKEFRQIVEQRMREIVSLNV